MTENGSLGHKESKQNKPDERAGNTVMNSRKFAVKAPFRKKTF